MYDINLDNSNKYEIFFYFQKKNFRPIAHAISKNPATIK